MKSSIKFIGAPIAIAVAAALAVYGCGSSGGGESTLGGAGGGGGVVVAGAIVNNAIDGAPLKATCADGTAGGTGVSVKGTYSMTVSCASTNFPVVIAIDQVALAALATPPTMADSAGQFCSAANATAGLCVPTYYKTTERAPLKVAVPSFAEASNLTNLNGATTLAATPIEDKIKAYVAAPTTAVKPTAADVQTAEANVQTNFGVASVRSSDPIRDAQAASLNTAVLSAVAITKANAAATVKPEDIMSALATAVSNNKPLVTTQADGSKTVDIATVQTSLTSAALLVTGTDAASVARKASMATVNTAFTGTLQSENTIKTWADAASQVAKVVAAVPSVVAFDPTKQNLASGTIAADIKAAVTASTAGTAALMNANLSSQAMAQAVTKAQEIDASTTIPTANKTNLKAAVFSAAQSIVSSVATDVGTKAAAGALTANQQAQALAQVSMATQLAGDQIKTATYASIVDATTGLPKASVAGLAEKVSTDVAAQISTKTATDLGNISTMNPTTILGASTVTTMQTAATNVVSALANFTPPAGVGTAVVQAAVNSVISTIGTSDTTNSTVQTNIQNTITAVANSLNGVLSNTVTVGGTTGALSALPTGTQVQMLQQAAATMMQTAATTAGGTGATTLNFSTPPTPGSVTTALNTATTTVNQTVVTTSDSPTLSVTTLTGKTGQAVNTEACSADVTVSGINVGVPIKVAATVAGQPVTMTAGDIFAAPPTPGVTPPSTGLLVYVKADGGLAKFYPDTNGRLVGALNNGQKFALCVKPIAAGTTYVVTAQVGSVYNFATDTFATPSKVKTISFEASTAAAATTTTTPTTTTIPVTTTTAAAATTTTTAAATTTTTAAATTTTTTAAATTTTTTAPTTTTTAAATTTTTTAATATTTTTTAAATTTTTTAAVTTTTVAAKTLGLGTTATVGDGVAGVGVNDAVNAGAAYTGSPISIGPYTVSGLSAATNVTMFGTFASFQKISINGGTPVTSGSVSNGDTLTVIVDLAAYATDQMNTVGSPLTYNNLYQPKIKAGTVTITFGSAAVGGGILTCADPNLPPPAGNSPCK